MKTIKKILGTLLACAAIFPLLYSCADEIDYSVGDPDMDGCFGVYFSSQAVSLTLDPDDELVDTLTVYRTNTAGAITVPYEFTNESGVFVIENDIMFADGQDSTIVVVSFGTADLGTTYTCSIAITDPQYVSYYNSGSPEVRLSVLRDKWNDLGNCLYTDDFFTTFYPVDNVTWEVPVYESAINPGLFRLEYPYDGKYKYNDSWETDPENYDYGKADWDTSKIYYLVVNATDPDCVYIEPQEIGVDWADGMISVISIGYYKYMNGNTWADIKAAGLGGTYKDGYITFPEGGLGISEANYKDGGWYNANLNGAFKIALPGASDYSLKITADESSNGEVPLKFTLGDDVATVKYQIYKGTLNATTVAANAEAIAADKDAKILPDTGTISVKLDTTGIYTIVAVSFDKENKAQETASLQFSYLAAGDKMPVTAGVELSNTNRYASAGNTAYSTFEFCIYGTDLTSVKYDLVNTESYEQMPAYYQAQLKKGAEVKTEVLKTINSLGGYTGILTDLTPGTSYTLLVWASNGYESSFLTAEASTAGTWISKGTGDYSYSVYFYDSVEYIYDAAGKVVDYEIIPYVDKGLELSQLEEDPTLWKISHWGYDVDFLFSYDAKTGKVQVDDQYTGFTDASYGQVYVDDIANEAAYVKTHYKIDSKDYPSYFDEKSQTFYFSVLYYGVTGDFGWGYETFEVGMTTDAGTAKQSPVSYRSLSLMNESDAFMSRKTTSLYDRIVPTDGSGREVKTATYSVKEVSTPATATSPKTFSKGSPKKSAKKVEPLK